MTLTEHPSHILDYAEPPPRSAFARLFTSPWLLVPLILLLAASLRFFRVGYESFWLDEFLAVQNSTGRGQAHMDFQRNVVVDPPPHLTRLSDGPGLGAIWTSLDTDSHPPLYFMVLNVWRHLFGESDAAARGLSVAFSLLSILLLFDVARMLHGRAVALWAALLMALAGAQIQYAQEARNYTMLMALTLGACDAVVRIAMHGPRLRRSIALSACALLMLLTHYLAAPALVAIALYALIRLRGRSRRDACISLAGAVFAFAVCWGPWLYQQTHGFSREISAAVQGENWSLRAELQRLAMLPLRYFTEPLKSSRWIGQISAVMFILPIILLPKRRDLLLWCLLGGCVIFWVFTSDVLRHANALAYVRYTLLASPAVYALSAAMLWHMQGFLRHLVPAVLTIACIAAIDQPYSVHKANTRELARIINAHCDPDDILLVHTLADRDWQARALYLGIAHYAPPRCPVVFIGDPPPPELRQRILGATDVWIVSPTQSIPIDEILPDAEVMHASYVHWVGTLSRIRPAGR